LVTRIEFQSGFLIAIQKYNSQFSQMLQMALFGAFWGQKGVNGGF